MYFTVRQSAGGYDRFSKGAFDSQIGMIVPVNFKTTEDGPAISQIGEARLVKVDILDDGETAELSFETMSHDNDINNLVTRGVVDTVGRMAFAFKEVPFIFREHAPLTAEMKNRIVSWKVGKPYSIGDASQK